MRDPFVRPLTLLAHVLLATIVLAHSADAQTNDVPDQAEDHPVWRGASSIDVGISITKRGYGSFRHPEPFNWGYQRQGWRVSFNYGLGTANHHYE